MGDGVALLVGRRRISKDAECRLATELQTCPGMGGQSCGRSDKLASKITSIPRWALATPTAGELDCAGGFGVSLGEGALDRRV